MKTFIGIINWPGRPLIHSTGKCAGSIWPDVATKEARLPEHLPSGQESTWMKKNERLAILPSKNSWLFSLDMMFPMNLLIWSSAFEDWRPQSNHLAPSLHFSKSGGCIAVGTLKLSFLLAACSPALLVLAGSSQSHLHWMPQGVWPPHYICTVENSDCSLDVFLHKCKCLCYLGFGQPYTPMHHCFVIYFVVVVFPMFHFEDILYGKICHKVLQNWE